MKETRQGLEYCVGFDVLMTTTNLLYITQRFPYQTKKYIPMPNFQRQMFSDQNELSKLYLRTQRMIVGARNRETTGVFPGS